jgi:hypothetical protein
VRLEDAGMADIEDLAPELIVIIEELGKHDSAILATGKRKPSDAKFFASQCHRYWYEKRRRSESPLVYQICAYIR